MPLSASVFRRGGPKKELFDVINEDVDDEKELDEKLAELEELLQTQKFGRELSAAIWRPSLCAAELVKQRKQSARDVGFIRGRRIYLHVEEAVFLVDRGDLLLFIEEAEETQVEGTALGTTAVYGEDAVTGGRRRPRQRLLSVQEAFDLMMSVGVNLERYLLYSSLSRSGYLVMRHPSRWLLDREEHPEQVWGSGAWAACYGREPAVPGTLPPQPMQQQLVAAAAASTAAGAGGGGSMPAAGPGAGSDAARQGGGAADGDAMDLDAAQPQPQSAGMQQPQQPQQPQRRSGPAGGAGASPAPPSSSCRGWWQAAGPSHPHLGGVPEEFFKGQPPAPVQDRLASSLRAQFPSLRPCPTIRSALAEAARATVTTAPVLASNPAASAAAAAAAAVAGSTTRAAPSAGAPEPIGAPAAVGGGVSGGVSLGSPGQQAHLVFDVYKPGSFVSRYKGQFPAVHTHVAICSAAPPALGEMRAADAAAAASAAAGEGQRPASVSWAAVLNGDIALYSIGEADLLSLI